MHNYCITSDPHEKSEGEPGRFFHMSDVSGRELEMLERLDMGMGGTTCRACFNHTTESGTAKGRLAGSIIE